MDQEVADIESQTTNKVVPDIFQKRNRRVTLKFEDVVYKIKTKTEEKTILNGVTGIVEPGEVLAMLGPSGSGKTTLLTALGGRLGGGKLHGTITYNGDKFSNSMKRNTGFVTQDDVLYPHLTVTETLVFSALLRLPNSFTKKDKISQAEAVIEQLGLTNCKDSIIGGPLLRGVSGGERKRVSIGQEMLVNPSLLFLDEPTSGLDSTTAQRIVSCLWELAKGGRTIIMTIHQPSSRLYYLFHKVFLLSEGSAMYFGKASEATQYFSSLGFSPQVAMNPSDFLLDLANGVCSEESREDPATVKQKLISEYKNNLDPQLKALLHEIGDSGQRQQDKLQDKLQDKEFGKWPTFWWQQFSVLLRRGVKERKHESFSALRIAQVVVVAAFAGLLWFRSDTSHLQDQIGLLFFIVSFWAFFPLFQAIFTFPQERMMLQKERSSGTYRLSSYFMSRMVADLPMELALPTLFLLITYWMAGLKSNPKSFFCTLLTLLLSVLVSQGIGLALGALVMDQKAATTLGSVLMLSFTLAGGFYVQHVPVFIAWIKYVSVSYYTYRLFVGSQYSLKDTYPCSEGKCLVAEFPAIKQIEISLKGQLVAALALGIMLVGYRLVAYFALMRIGVTKKIA